MRKTLRSLLRATDDVATWAILGFAAITIFVAALPVILIAGAWVCILGPGVLIKYSKQLQRLQEARKAELPEYSQALQELLSSRKDGGGDRAAERPATVAPLPQPGNRVVSGSYAKALFGGASAQTHQDGPGTAGAVDAPSEGVQAAETATTNPSGPGTTGVLVGAAVIGTATEAKPKAKQNFRPVG